MTSHQQMVLTSLQPAVTPDTLLAMYRELGPELLAIPMAPLTTLPCKEMVDSLLGVSSLPGSLVSPPSAASTIMVITILRLLLRLGRAPAVATGNPQAELPAMIPGGSTRDTIVNTARHGDPTVLPPLHTLTPTPPPPRAHPTPNHLLLLLLLLLLNKPKFPGPPCNALLA